MTSVVVLPAGHSLHRFHAAGFDPVYFDRSRSGRLNAPDGTYDVMYTTMTVRGAFADTFLRHPGVNLIDETTGFGTVPVRGSRLDPSCIS